MKSAVLLAVLVSLAVAASADVVYFKNGGSIEGKVVPAEGGVIVKLPAGEVRITQEAIERIEKGPSTFDEYQKRLGELKADDADAQYKLGLWCRSVGMKSQAGAHFEKAIAVQPDHAGARQALGYRLVGGKWLSEEEEMRARGLVKHEGQWMTPEAAAKLQELKAQLDVAREKRLAAEAELQRVQEEARAAEQAPPPDFPIYTNPYDYYYSTRQFRDSRTYYWAPSYSVPYYYGPYGAWWFYPGGRRSISPSHRRSSPPSHRGSVSPSRRR